MNTTSFAVQRKADRDIIFLLVLEEKKKTDYLHVVVIAVELVGKSLNSGSLDSKGRVNTTQWRD